jgi:hypothetical protein
MSEERGFPMSKIVYVQRPEGIEAPQRVWVREPEQPAPRPDEPGDYRVEATHPLFPLTTEAQVQAWIRERFHTGLWEALRHIRFV